MIIDQFACYGTDSEYQPSTSMSSDSFLDSNTSPQTRVQTRKRKRNTHTWQRIKSKRLKNLGQSYQNATGREVPAKIMKGGCTEKCRLKCHEKLPDKVRQEIFNFFYKLGSKVRQWNYIANSVQVIDKKITKISCGESRRKSSRLYYLNPPEEKHLHTRVCLKMFLDTLAISNQVVDSALLKAVSDGTDNRGKKLFII